MRATNHPPALIPPNAQKNRPHKRPVVRFWRWGWPWQCQDQEPSERRGLHAHAAHATHTAHATHVGSTSSFSLRSFSNHALGGQQQRSHGSGVLQCSAGHLGGVQDTHFQHVAVGVVGSVEAEVALALQHSVHHHRRLATGIGHDFAQRSFHSLQHQLDTSVLLSVAGRQAAHGLLGAQQSHATARNNTFFHSSAGSVQGVFHAGFLFLHFDFGSSAHLDHGNTASQLGHALLQFFAVVVGSGFFDLATDLLDAGFDFVGLTSTIDDGGVFFADFDASSLAQVFQSHFFQRQAHFFSDDLTASQDSDVFQHGLATVAKARSLHSHPLQDAADGVHHQSCQGFAFGVFSNDQQRTASLGHSFQCGQQVADGADLLVEQQHEGVVQNSGLLFGVVDEVGRQVATVKLHAFDDIQFVGQALAFFHSDHAFFAHCVHGLSDDFAHISVGVGRDGAHLSDFFAGGGGLGLLLQLFHQSGDSLVDTALQIHGVQTSGNVLGAFAHDGLGQHGSGSGTVTSDVVGLGSHFLHELSAHVLQLVFEFHFLGHGHTVLGHSGGAKRTLQHHVAAFGAQGHFHGVGQNVHAFDHAGAGVGTENYVFCCHFWLLKSVQNHWLALSLQAPAAMKKEDVRDYCSTTANRSSSFMTSSSWPFIFTVWPLYLPNRTRSPTFTFRGDTTPWSFFLPGPTASTSP